jgi:hypothetical protein
MKVKGPIVTLAVGAAVAGGLLIADLTSSGGSSAPVTTAAAGATASSSTTAASASGSASASASAAAAAVSPSASTVTAAAAVQASGPPATHAGKVNGGGSLAIVIKGASAVAYLCDGVNEAWLWGSVDGNTLSLHDKTGGTLTGTRGGGKIVGSLTVKGKTWSFSVPSVKKPSGLYRSTATVRGAKIVGGWVVLPDGTQVGRISAADGTGQGAPPLDLTTGQVTVEGQTLTAAPADPETAAG